MKTEDVAVVARALEGFHDETFSVEDWMDHPKNIAIVNGDDLSIFTYERPGVYTGHFFYTSRGKEALRSAKTILAEVFQYDVTLLMGLTPADKLGAKWLARKIGFKSHGDVETPQGVCELFILTRKEYEEETA
jgi:hypothetical protein